jgi:hypothetical protein
MKLFGLLLALLLCAGTPSFAQWSDNSNKFNDSLHMPVSTVTDNQARPIVVQGEDDGYFVLWEDERDHSTKKRDIYAQKYDKAGHALWAANGVPVANSANDEFWQSESFGNYRRYSLAAPDGSGGLYVCWNYLVQTGNSSNNYGVAAQHLHADGTQVFGDGGFNIAAPGSDQYGNPQMVPDSKGGFFIAYTNFTDVYTYCYKDDGGTLKQYGGGVMNVYGQEQQTTTDCGPQTTVSYYIHAKVQAYMLYPDQQGGCNVVMALQTGLNEMYMGYNRLARVKKDCQATLLKRKGGDDPAQTTIRLKNYKKDSVVRVYNFTTYTYEVSCHPFNNPNNTTVVTITKIENNGYGFLPLNIGHPQYYVDLPQGVVLPTGGNINAEIMSASQRDAYTSNYHLHGYYRLNEIYDSIPYELCTDMDHPYEAYRPILPDNAIPTDTLTSGPDTLIGHVIDRGPTNYFMAGSGNKVWATTLGSDANNVSVYLQELKLVPDGTKRYKFVINTKDKLGLKIGEQIFSGTTETNVLYDLPSLATDNNGNGLFYVMQTNRVTRVSPIGDGGILTWGLMGKPIGSGYWGGAVTSVHPMAVLSRDGNGLVAWDSDRQLTGSNAQNVWMQRITNAFTPSYQPPLNTLSLLTSSSYASEGTYLTGSTDVWTTIDGLVFKDKRFTTPLMSLKDNYPLGVLKLITNENSGATRFTNGIPYLNRNFKITVDNNPNGSGNIPMRFYIPQVEFDGLKTADPGIANPGDLGIIEQASTNPAVPSTYTPATGDQMLPLTGWGAIDGGYYIEFIAKGFSDFFISKGVIPLPLKWLDLQGKLTTPAAAAISWTVTEEKNVTGYTVQYSADGTNFIDGCTQASSNSGSMMSYSCSVPLPAAGTYLFRVKQEDLDGKFSYSKIISLRADVAAIFSVSPNPTSSAAVLRIPHAAAVKKLILLSINGNAVWQRAGALSGSVTIPMEQLPAGVYHLRVIEDTNEHILKIIKK